MIAVPISAMYYTSLRTFTKILLFKEASYLTTVAYNSILQEKKTFALSSIFLYNFDVMKWRKCVL